jgi:AcrR family transcriptional regulator
MSDVAAAIGVRAPSLYGHFENRAALIAAVELMLWQELRLALVEASGPRDPFRTLELSNAFRLGGGLDAAFENRVRTIIEGLKAKPRAQRRAKALSKP